MNPNTATPKSPTRRSRLRRAFKVIGALCVFVFVGLLLYLGVMVVQEMIRPMAPPRFESDTKNLLVLAEPPSVDADRSIAAGAIEQDGILSQATAPGDPTTSSSSGLRFKPIIPDSPDLPVKIRELRSRLNADYDRMLRDIEAYEKTKDTLSWDQARELLDRIENQNEAIWGELNAVHGNSYSMQGWTGELIKSGQDYQNWKMESEVEINAKGQRWIAAASWCDRILDQNRFDWEHKLWMATPNRPVFKSDYFRQNSAQDWDHMIAFYRRAGGLDGHAQIASAVLGRQKENLTDIWKRAEWHAREAVRRR